MSRRIREGRDSDDASWRRAPDHRRIGSRDQSRGRRRVHSAPPAVAPGQATPRLVRVWAVLVVIGLLVFELPSPVSGTSREQRLRDAVTTVVREATGSDPASGLLGVVHGRLGPGRRAVRRQLELGTGHGRPRGMPAARDAVQHRANPFELADFAHGLSAPSSFETTPRHLCSTSQPTAASRFSSQ